MRPFFLGADAQAVRAFSDICEDAEHPVAQHPDDYSLCRVGGFDDQDGKIYEERVQVLTNGLAMKAKHRKIDTEATAALREKIELGNGADASAGDSV